MALKITEGPAVLRQCSRATPGHVAGYWELTPDTVALLEHNFWRLSLLLGKPVWKPTTHADSVAYQSRLENSWDQYIGVVIDGQRYVYINHGVGDIQDCKTKACVICDGGPSFWGVLFNVNTLEFSQFHWNGIG